MRGRALLVALVAVVSSFAVLAAGPNASGAAASTIVLPPPVAPAPLGLGGIGLASQGATGLTIGQAVSASSTGAGMNVVAGVGGPSVAGGAAAAGAGAVAAPVAVGAAGLAIGWGIGTFLCKADAAVGDDPSLCGDYDPNPTFVPNTDVAVSGEPGWSPSSTTVVSQPNPACTSGGGVTVSWTHVGAATYGATTSSGMTLTSTNCPTGAGFPSVSFVYTIRCQDGTVPAGGTSAWGAFAGTGTPPPITVSGTCTLGHGGLALTSFHLSSGADNVERIFYPEGHPLDPRPPANPVRTWVTKGQCVRGASVDFVEEESISFTDDDLKFPKYPDVECPSGRQLKRLEVHKLTPSLAPPADDVVVWEWDNPGLKPADGTDPVIPGQRWEECAGGTCTMRLWKLLPGDELDCLSAWDTGACTDWVRHLEDDPATYECRYGTRMVLALEECLPYRFPKVKTVPSTETGQMPRVEVDPNPPPTDECYAARVAAVPCYGNPADPTPPADAPPDTEGVCPPEAGFLSFLNPFWLFRTLKCAFVPSQAGLRAGWASADVDWCETAPGAAICAVDALVGPFGDLGDGDTSDCLGAGITIPNTLSPGDTDDGEVHPFQACGQLAQVSEWWLLFSSAAIYLGGALTGARILGGTIGARESVPA